MYFVSLSYIPLPLSRRLGFVVYRTSFLLVEVDGKENEMKRGGKGPPRVTERQRGFPFYGIRLRAGTRL